MGACCTKDANFAAITAQEMEECENEFLDEEYHNVTKGEYGASIRVNGSSAFVSMSTQQGRKGVNQDSMTVWEDYLGETGVIFCGVFDGHGPLGHRVSHCVRDNIPCKIGSLYKMFQHGGRNQSNVDLIHDSYNSEDDDDGGDEDEAKTSVLSSWNRSIIRSFKEMDKELSSHISIDTYCSGTTGITVIKQGDDLVIGNLGDSRAILGKRGDKGQLVPVQLTVDLKPSITSEADRIRRCTGRVFALDEEPDVLRVWQPDEDCPGLAMTRAFGDFCLKDCGVISTPQLFHRKLTDIDEFVVLATDGIWDVLTNSDVVEIVSSTKKRSMAAKLIITYATRAWKSHYPSSRIDDMAVVCLFLKQPEIDQSTSADSMARLNYSSISSRLSGINCGGPDLSMSGRTKSDVDNETPRSTGTVVTPRAACAPTFRRRKL
ncbi:hypothetical protein V2J09_007017 [Rumex salicifolius]